MANRFLRFKEFLAFKPILARWGFLGILSNGVRAEATAPFATIALFLGQRRAF